MLLRGPIFFAGMSRKRKRLFYQMASGTNLMISLLRIIAKDKNH